jgi:hypothetical protein
MLFVGVCGVQPEASSVISVYDAFISSICKLYFVQTSIESSAPVSINIQPYVKTFSSSFTLYVGCTPVSFGRSSSFTLNH